MKHTKEIKNHTLKVITIMRTIFLVLFGVFCGIGISLIDSYLWQLPIANFIVAFVCIIISIVLDKLLFEMSYK